MPSILWVSAFLVFSEVLMHWSPIFLEVSLSLLFPPPKPLQNTLFSGEFIEVFTNGGKKEGIKRKRRE
jgi:hypothetical protein